MLRSLMGTTGCEVARMNMRLRYAGDIEALWYLRTDLFDILVPLRGEAVAQKVLDTSPPCSRGNYRCPCAPPRRHRNPGSGISEPVVPWGHAPGPALLLQCWCPQ